MKRLIVLTLLCVPFGSFAQAPATICEEGTEWVPEIEDCAVVVRDQSDIEFEEAKQKAEDLWAKVQSWYQNLLSWKETCLAPINTGSNIDPNAPKGILKSLNGNASISRGMETLSANAGMELYPGDTIAIGKDSSATLDLRDTGELTVSAETRFHVPNTDKSQKNIVQKAGLFFEGAWTRVKKCTQGEKFEIKTPSPGGGVRG